MKFKKSNILTIVICAAILSVTSYHSGYAAADSGIQYNSQGKIVFDNGTKDTTDDVVFDAADFFLIDSMVTRGKTAVKNELNQYEGIEINEDIPAFDTLAASVSALADGTDATSENILTGKKALVGKNIVTGTMIDHSGDQISAGDIIENENGTMVEITIPGGYYDEETKVTIPIDTIEQLPTINSNLSGMHKVFVVSNGTDMKKLLPDHYKELTINNFYVFPPASSSNGDRLGNVSGTEGNPYLAVSFNSGTFSYNPDTGIFSLGNGNAVANYDLGYKTMTTSVVYGKAICVYPSI